MAGPRKSSGVVRGHVRGRPARRTPVVTETADHETCRVVAVDPSAESSGVAVLAPHGAGHPAALLCAWTVSLAKVREADVLEDLGRVVGSARWVAVLERPFNRRGPCYGERWWRNSLEHLARGRAQVSGERFRRPLIMRPYPQQWRGCLGLPTQGDRGLLKRVAIARAENLTGKSFDSDDAAEAALLGLVAAGWLKVGDPRWVPVRARWVA